MPRPTFDDFLNSPGPSTPNRGRGGGGGGGSRGRGRGGIGSSSRGGAGPSRGGATPRMGRGGKSFSSDYSNVGFNYDSVNNQKYTKMEGFTVAPYGGTPAPPPPSSTPGGGYKPQHRAGRRVRGDHTPLSGVAGMQTPGSSNSLSGSATPVTGLGYHKDERGGRSKGKGRAYNDRSGIEGGGGTKNRLKAGQTVGREGVMWGGGAAPMFVKAGELFKDGEADIVTMGKDHELHVEAVPMDDPSAPQMTDLEDEAEIDLFDLPPELATELESPVSQAQEEIPPSPLDDRLRRPSLPPLSQEDRIQSDPTPFFAPEPGHGRQVWTNQTVEAQSDSDAFFVDTEPVEEVQAETSYTYTRHESTTIGVNSSATVISEDEQIIFRPKTYPKPQPMTLEQRPPPSPPAAAVPGPSHFNGSKTVESRLDLNPYRMTRKEKKAAKKDKRGRAKGKGKKKNQKKMSELYEDSDIEWGSDGPPANILSVNGVGESEEEDDDEHDVEVLRDYLAGTLLGAQSSEDEEMGEKDVGTGEGENAGSDMDSDTDSADTDLMRAFGDGAAEIGEEDIDDLESGEEDNNFDWETSSGSGDDSSELGDLAFATTSKTRVVDEESDDDDVDAMFEGKDSWDETEWFIRNVEETLDPHSTAFNDRKSRNALFKTIENGDFGDEWDLAPKKKGKNKKSLIPLELQDQWEVDRQRKAEKKRQRELDRLVTSLDSSLKHHHKAKGKGKGSSKIDQARMAHLIPASASRVAELFDIPSDYEEASAPLGKMSKMANLLLPGGRGLASVDEGIKKFIVDQGRTTYSVPPMDKEGRRKVHMLAECYGLNSKSKGKGHNRFTVLIKTGRTGLDIKEDKIQRLLSASSFSGGQFYKALYSKPRGEKGGKRGPGDRGNSARMREGETVGEGAERIGMENIGHKLLSRMGWAEGGKIGRSDGGLEDPIIAIVKNTKSGLGA